MLKSRAYSSSAVVCEPSTRDSTCRVVEAWGSLLSQLPEVGLKAPCDSLPTRPVIQMGEPDSITNKGFIRSRLSKESLTWVARKVSRGLAPHSRLWVPNSTWEAQVPDSGEQSNLRRTMQVSRGESKLMFSGGWQRYSSLYWSLKGFSPKVCLCHTSPLHVDMNSCGIHSKHHIRGF